ncbi:6-phosphogluconolactonase (cycloisomerase 2 family) [Spirilliplanes yamanashiensis]|nr:lactonase family protein [Spirilliplanes yamanashiensis]MDP9816322.1 6-phosphogluconolactonase (cycloisomerase 2 family) [Spirilliplanes yamanashiensis]
MGVHGAELIFVGCYTGDAGDGEGVVLLRRDPATGALSRAGVAARTPSPSFLARHPHLPVLYAVNELTEGTVSAWTVDADGGLTPLAVQPTGGAHPCHLAVTADGRHLVAANYGSGSVAVLPLDAAGAPGERTDLVRHEGAGPVADRQEGPHAHMVAPDPDGSGLLAVDLGADRVFRYVLDPVSGRLTAPQTPLAAEPGSGPRHLARHPDGTLYVVAELAATLTGWRVDPATGALAAGEARPTSDGPGPVYPSELAIGRDGRFTYVANRGPDTVAVFDDERRVAEVPTGGTWPRHLALMGDHLYVANERSHSVVAFALGAEDGVPRALGEPTPLPSPTCVLPWVPAAR